MKKSFIYLLIVALIIGTVIVNYVDFSEDCKNISGNVFLSKRIHDIEVYYIVNDDGIQYVGIYYDDPICQKITSKSTIRVYYDEYFNYLTMPEEIIDGDTIFGNIIRANKIELESKNLLWQKTNNFVNNLFGRN